MAISMRRLGRTAVGAVLAFWAAVSPSFGGDRAASASPSWAPYAYERVKIAEGVYAFVEPKMHGIVSGNVIAVIGKHGILIFDTGHHPPMARAIAREIRGLSDKPVRAIVVSHWHDDHWAGTAEFSREFPEALIVAHPFTARRMADRERKFAGAPCRAELEEQVKPLRLQLAAGTKQDGSALPADGRAMIAEEVAAFAEQIRECGLKRFRGVDATFESSLTLDLGGREVQLQHIGRANTAGDVVAYVPDDKVLLTGDIVVFPFPFSTQSYISAWAAVLRKLDAMDLATIVPGHGPPLHDKRYLEDLAALFESLARQARAAYRPGMTVEELRAKIDFAADSAKFSHGDKFIKANFDYMIGQPAIDRLWQELAGQWQPEGD